MDLDKYLKLNRMSATKFSAYSEIGLTTVYKLMRGIKVTKRVADIVEKCTEGKVKSVDIVTKEVRKYG